MFWVVSSNPGTLDTNTGAVPTTRWWKAERFIPARTSLTTLGEKTCDNCRARLEGRMGSVSRPPTAS